MSLNVGQWRILLLLCFFIVSSAGKSSKSSIYCRLPHCGVKNLACNNNRNTSSVCIPGSKMINMSPHKGHMLNLLNNFRNKVAAGYTRTLYPAGRMARMSWSTELEDFAKKCIRKCLPEPRPCMSSRQFTSIGSTYDGLNFVSKTNSHTIQEIVEELMLGWFEDANFVTRRLLLHLTNDFRKPSVRQVVLLMTDRNTHVGCSGMMFKTDFTSHFRMACTFATDNMNHRPIYEISADAGKLCKKRDTTYKNLCAVGENYNNNHKYKEGELLLSSDDEA